MFWEAVEDWRIKKNYSTTGAKLIYETYIADEGMHQINISDGCSMSIETSLELAAEQPMADPTIFDRAVEEVLQLMKLNSFLPFILSDEYKKQFQNLSRSSSTSSSLSLTDNLAP